jgi:hypothetical protein
LKKWLVEYKFREWATHGTDPQKLNQPVTQDEKRQRAEEIAKNLSDNRLWHSHGRMISATTLSAVLRLKIEDYSADTVLRPLVRQYSDLITDYTFKNDRQSFMHSRCYF